MTKYTKMSEEQAQQIDDMLDDGYGNTAIAEKVFGRKSMESTIRRYRKKKESEPEYPIQEEVNEDLDENILDSLCESDDYSVSNLAKRLRTAQRTNTQLRKIQREVFDNEDDLPSLEEVISKALDGATSKARICQTYNFGEKAKSATLEVLLSDYQIGKVTRFYNTEKAIMGMMKYGREILKEIERRKDQYNIERIVVGMIGDLVEDHMKHGVGSAISTDSGLAEQMHNAITSIWQYLIEPLASIGVEMEVVCVVGNHGSSTHKGMGNFKEGRYSYDYVIHKTLESFCKVAGYDNVKFNIPDGTFATTDFYGKHAIYEHGYHNNMSEKGMVDQMRKRGSQLQIHPTYWRQGDKHHHICYGQGEQVLNGAFFGTDIEGIEYSGVLGFSGTPSQTIMFHTPETSVGKKTVKDIVNIQLFIED